MNKILGVVFYKSKDWGFLAIKDFGKIKNDKFIVEGLEMTAEEIWKELRHLICIATKYNQDKPEYKGLFSPSITLNITPKEEISDLGHESF